MTTNNKKTIFKLWIVSTLLFFSVVISYSVPRARYVGTDIISKIDIPQTINDWRGEDISNQLNIDFTKDTNKFIAETKVIQYINKQGDKLLLILMDAGNFHNPKVCFTSAGYKIRELDDTELNLSSHTIQAHTLYTEKNRETSVSLYWIIIDKKITHTWIKQKIKQLYFSMFNRKRVGLMVRFDVAANKDNIDNAIITAKQFINSFYQTLLPETADYLFGIKE